MRVGVGTIGVVGLAVLAAIFFRGGGGSGSGGTGSGTSGTAATQAMLPAQPRRPLQVVIRGNDYLVNERPVDLSTLMNMVSKVPPGSGPAVMIEQTQSSRAKAEKDLKDELTKKQVPFTAN